MNRRNFLINGLGLSAGTLLGAQMVQGMIIHPDANKTTEPLQANLLERIQSKYSHRLPESDRDYMRHRSYIEEVPVSGIFMGFRRSL
jgi:hypothetical protein